MQHSLEILQPTAAPAAAPRAGDFVVDFGGETVVGLSARQVAALLDSEKFSHIKIFRIHRATPDGRMELVGVSRERFQLEDGFVFFRATEAAARGDFERLEALAAATPPPCRARLHLVRLPDVDRPCVTALLYPAEYSEEFSAWLMGIGFDGGDRVEGGIGVATRYLQREDALLVDRAQWWGTLDGTLAEQADANEKKEHAAAG